MIREWATEDTLDKIAEALKAPAGWRDPDTGLPAGWEEDDDDEWRAFESAMRG